MEKKYAYPLFFLLFLSCKKECKNALDLSYIKDNQHIYIQLQNNTGKDVVFLAPNSLEFGDENYKSYSTQGSKEHDYPINVYAIIEPNQSSPFYQNKLDSVHNSYLAEIGNAYLIGDERPGDGNSVFYLKINESIKIKYKLSIQQSGPHYKYSSKFKQTYYPYNKVLKENYPEGEYLRKFSKLNLGKVRFVAQPCIKDSLFLTISQSDITR